MKIVFGGFISLLLFIVPVCVFSSSAAVAQEAAPVPVLVSIIPQKYFVEKIGGKFVEVEVMVPPGATPEQYEPKPKQMSAVSKAGIYFACGVPFESIWLSKIASTNPKMVVVHTEKEVEKRVMEAHSDHHGEEKPGGHAAHDEGEELPPYPPQGGMNALQQEGGKASPQKGEKDPHIWLSPRLVMVQARAIFEALAATDPQNREAFEANYKSFLGELGDLDSSIARLFASKKGGGYFMVFHPAWGYFADAYGLKQVPVEVEGKEPRARDFDKVIKFARDLGIKTVFVQPQYSPRTAQTIADAIGGRLVYADDLAADWDKNLLRVAAEIAAAPRRQ